MMDARYSTFSDSCDVFCCRTIDGIYTMTIAKRGLEQDGLVIETQDVSQFKENLIFIRSLGYMVPDDLLHIIDVEVRYHESLLDAVNSLC